MVNKLSIKADLKSLIWVISIFEGCITSELRKDLSRLLTSFSNLKVDKKFKKTLIKMIESGMTIRAASALSPIITQIIYDKTPIGRKKLIDFCKVNNLNLKKTKNEINYFWNKRPLMVKKNTKKVAAMVLQRVGYVSCSLSKAERDNKGIDFNEYFIDTRTSPEIITRKVCELFLDIKGDDLVKLISFLKQNSYACVKES